MAEKPSLPRKLNQTKLLTSGNTTLIPLDELGIEQVRIWRNKPEISKNMEFSGYISETDQLNWFNSLAKETNYYFIIHYKQKQIGLIHLNKFNEKEQSAHAGLFIGEDTYTGTGASISASLLLLSFAFEELNLEFVYAKVKRNNKPAIDYNIGLGFEFEQEINASFCLYKTHRNAFDKQKTRLQKLAQMAEGELTL